MACPVVLTFCATCHLSLLSAGPPPVSTPSLPFIWQRVQGSCAQDFSVDFQFLDMLQMAEAAESLTSG
jgi:hypothetical protein